MRRSGSGINLSMVVRTLCLLLLFEAGFMIVPTIVALCNGERGAFEAFGISAAATCLCGLCGIKLIPARRRDMGRRESILLTALVWIVFSLFGQIPYMLAPTTKLSFSAAFFEAMSGFTTTGASLVESAETLSYSVHVWRCLSQWIGGLGIIIFTLALLPMLNSSGGLLMFNAEQNKIAGDKISPRISSTARRLWGVYLLLTVILFVLLWAGPMSLLDAVCYALSVTSTGGFSTTSAGINAYSGVYVKTVVTLFMFLGGVNFAMIFRASMGQFRAVAANETFLIYCKAICAATAVFAVSILVNGKYSGWESVTLDPLFQVVSFITSTGYILTGFDGWGMGVFTISMMLVFMGGCAGSTSGGAKIDRVVYLLKYLRNQIQRTLRPNSVNAVKVNGRPVPMEQVNKVVAFLALYALLIVAGTSVLAFLGVPLDQSLTASLGAIGNASLSLADSTMGCDYAAMGGAAHYVLSFLMLTGRLELFTVLVLFTRGYWRI